MTESLQGYSDILDEHIGSFIGHTLRRKGVISRETAPRLLRAVHREDMAAEVLEQLRTASTNVAESEVIPPALRTAEDFMRGQKLMFQYPFEGVPWSQAVVDTVDDDRLGLVTPDDKVSLTVHPTYIGIYPDRDYRTMMADRPGSGHTSIARFTVLLSLFEYTPPTKDRIRRVCRRFDISCKPLGNSTA